MFIAICSHCNSSPDVTFSTLRAVRAMGCTFLAQAARSVVDVDTADVVRLVCERAVWLDHGTMLADGSVDKVLDAYGASLQLLS